MRFMIHRYAAAPFYCNFIIGTVHAGECTCFFINICFTILKAVFFRQIYLSVFAVLCWLVKYCMVLEPETPEKQKANRLTNS